MRLAAGARLGPYEILAPLGAGAMGEVYQARDTRLDRAVALKILSLVTSSSADAQQRLEREARTISQLSHPHICALFDVGRADVRSPEGLRHEDVAQGVSPAEPVAYLVMELLDGETLADRLAAGALPLDLTLRYAIQMADALDRAHRHGVVHRDLKPSNVMITKAGVKLLDFGLAKAAAPLGSGTLDVETVAGTPPLTAAGAIAGTVQYMAPEQLEGRPADARSDIYALGAVIYEMATGKKAFRAAIDPIVPSALDRIVRTSLAVDPDERWQSAHDVRLQLGALAVDKAGAAPPRVRGWIRWLPWTIAAALAAAIALRPAAQPSETPHTVKFAVPPPADGDFYSHVESVGVSVSPDGSRIAYAGHAGSGPRRIWIRALTDLSANALAGTDGATSSFWSPDGNSLAFFAGGKLRRIDLRGGAPVTVCDVREGVGLGGTWGADGTLLFASIEGEAIWRVPANGGAPDAMLKPDRAANEARLSWPFFLPDGRHFLYLQRRLDGTGHLMFAQAGQPAKEIRPLQSSAQYVAPGYLLFAAEGALVAQRFDARRGEVSGSPFSVAEKVNYFYSTAYAEFAVSPTGTLVFADHDVENRVTLVDRSGQAVGLIGEAGRYQRMRLSPDGRHLAFDRFKAGAFDLWEVDLESRAETRLTFGQSSEGGAVWNPDGRSLFFSADQGAPPHLLRKDLVSGREESIVAANGFFQEPADITPDGKTLVFVQRGVGGNDIWQWPTDAARRPSAVLTTPFDEESVRLSPDGHALSFHSNASGRYEVYVAPFPLTGQPMRISIGGGASARWSRNGRELFYIADDNRLMSVPAQTTPALHLGTPAPLFRIDANHPWYGFEVSADGRFLAVVSQSEAQQQPVTVITNWTGQLDR